MVPNMVLTSKKAVSTVIFFIFLSDRSEQKPIFFSDCSLKCTTTTYRKDFYLLHTGNLRVLFKLMVLTETNTFKFQLCNHTSPGTQMLCFHGSFLPSLQKKRRQIASWHRLWLELGRYLIAFEPLTFVLD